MPSLRAAFAASMFLLLAIQPPRSERDWPAITRETKPWTRWWWQGSAVDRGNLTSELEALRDVGIGGVEVTPIYGVRGEETRFIPFLSESWVSMLDHALREAQRFDLGVDMATGTGWPFGGPWIDEANAPGTISHRTWTLEAGQVLADPIRLPQAPLLRALRNDPRPLAIADVVEPVTSNKDLQALAIEQIKYPRLLRPVAVVAYGDSGRITDLTGLVDGDGRLNWQASERSIVYALFSGSHGKMVERAAPGGEGYVIDHFSRNAIRSYLARFDRAFESHPPSGLRAFFNDSYEVDDATGQGNWTPLLLDEFQKRRGYDLRRHLPALLGAGNTDRDIRTLTDYRETISDLLLETFTTEWAAWARSRGHAVRNQAHGSPANLLDLYAASDIPETEGTEIARFKWATSAANVAGRRLVSAEAATWLGEHFRTTLADVRSAVDHFFVAGVNHIVYHGTAYSPDAAPWPGWQFYAAVEFNRRNAWWEDFAALNEYVTRTQSFLQSGRADHDVLLYFPFHDALATRGAALLTHFGGANRPTDAAGFEAAATTLERRGFTYDYISDRLLRSVRVENGRLVTSGGSAYAALVLPSSRFIPIDTLEHVLDLARRGAAIVMVDGGPSSVAGLASLEAREERFRRAIARLRASRYGGQARVLEGSDLEATLARVGILRERLVDHGLMFARRIDSVGRFYFVNNRSGRAFEGWVPLNITAPAATVFDPMTRQRGAARVRHAEPGVLEVYLQIPAAASLIVAGAVQPAREPHHFYTPAGAPVAVEGPWQVRFVKGGPVLPAPRSIARLSSWTMFEGDEHAKNFSGTACYSATFPAPPAGRADAWQLDLGRVRESARVRLNGRDLGTLIGPAFSVVLESGSIRQGNQLEVCVTNLSANRIADLDRRGVIWKKFYNVNMPARLPENRGADGLFTAAKWEPLDSGLVGPVTLTPLSPIK